MLGVSIGRVSLIVFTIATVFSIGLTAPIAYAMFLTPVEIIDSAGDGSSALNGSIGVATDSSGNVFVAGSQSDNVFKITPGGIITEIIDSTGDGSSSLDGPLGIATDSSGNVFVSGITTDNVFKITPGGTITEIINATGDGTNTLDDPRNIATDSSGNVFVVGKNTNNAFKIATPGTCSTGGTPCTITEIINSTGDGGWNPLKEPQGVATDSSGNVFVIGDMSHNAFKIATPGTCKTSGGTPCTITEIIDSTGDGVGNPLDEPFDVATDSSGNVFVTGRVSDNAFKIIKDKPIGGTVGSMSTTSLLVAGAQANIGLWSLALVGIVGAGAAIIYKTKSNKTKEE